MVSSEKNSSRSISPSSPQFSIIRRTSRSMVAACPFICSPRSAVLCSISARRSGRRVEYHALAEDRRHERVGLGLVELAVAGTEEELVGLGTGQQHHLLVGQLEPADVAALIAQTLHQPDRVGAEFFEMAVLLVAAGYSGHHCGGHVLSPPL